MTLASELLQSAVLPLASPCGFDPVVVDSYVQETRESLSLRPGRPKITHERRVPCFPSPWWRNSRTGFMIITQEKGFGQRERRVHTTPRLFCVCGIASIS